MERDLRPEAMSPPIANPTSATVSENALDHEADFEAETQETDEDFGEMYDSEDEDEAARVSAIESNDQQEAAKT